MGLLGNIITAILSSNSFDFNVLIDAFSNQDSIEGGFSEFSARSWMASSLLPVLALVPNEVDFLNVSSYFGLLLSPIPRSIYPDKPVASLGQVAGEIFFGVDYGIPTEPLGDAYWNFGIAGVIVIFIFFGFFHKYISEIFIKYSGQPALILLYSIVLFEAQPDSTSFRNMLMRMLPTYLILWLIGAISLGKLRNPKTEI